MTTSPSRCLRCRQPILTDDQSCEFKGQRWRCVSEDDNRVFEVDGLLIKNGWGVNPVPLLRDPYE